MNKAVTKPIESGYGARPSAPQRYCRRTCRSWYIDRRFRGLSMQTTSVHSSDWVDNSCAFSVVWPLSGWARLGGAGGGPNILLLIADDFGVDVASFYPMGASAADDAAAPPMPNLEALARRGRPVHPGLGEPVVLADAGGDADRPLRLPYRDRARQQRQPAAAADRARSPCPRHSPPPSARSLSPGQPGQVASEQRRERPRASMAGSTMPAAIPISGTCRAISAGRRPSTA